MSEKDTKLDHQEMEENIEAKEQEVDQEIEADDLVDEKEDLAKKLQNKEEEAKGYLDRLQRTMAEFDNFRKRTTKEKTAMYENGSKEILEAILPILDNFERALSSEKEDKENAFVQGIEMIYKQFKSILEDLGVAEIPAVGQEFNPDFHNAVTHVDDENYGENEVVEEFQKGYMFKDTVLRYSMVKVAN